MKCKFYHIESRLYDFFEFPGLLWEKKRMEKAEEEADEKVPLYNTYRDFLSKVEEKIAPYRKDIELFYDIGDHDFIGLITKSNQFFGYQSELEYLDFLSKMTAEEILQSISYGIISSNEDCHEFSASIMQRAKDISRKPTELIALIKEMPMDASAKWNLFVIIEEPIKHMHLYIDLMRQLLPIFGYFYEPFNNQVDSYGNHLMDFLNEHGAKGIEELSNSIIESRILANEETRLLITAMMPYSIALSGTGSNNYIAWGLHIEDALRHMKEINESKVIERVHVFKNLGDKTRYEVVKLIASGQTSTKEIATALGVSSATISYHINNLLQAKIIKLDRTDNKYGYVVDYTLLEVIISGLWADIGKPNVSVK